MGKFGSFLSITETPSKRNNFRHIRELEERKNSLLRSVPYAIANSVYEDLIRNIPNKGDYKELKDKLTLSEVGVGKQGAFSVYISTKGRSVKKTDASRTAIYVRVKKRRTKDLAIQILEDRGPWTMDTIPFWPDKGEAIIVQRKVTAREIDVIAKRQEKVKSKVRRELTRVGTRIPTNKKLKVSRKNKAVPDLAMLALELEFGGEGKRSKPVWRQALRKARSSGVQSLGKTDSHIRDAWYRPNSKSWKSWPKSKSKIAGTMAGKFVSFQKRLGYG